MDIGIRDRFLGLWRKRFGGEELPVTFFYTDVEVSVEKVRVPVGHQCLAVPMNKFIRMIENMEESFLITPSWGKVRKRFA